MPRHHWLRALAACHARAASPFHGCVRHAPACAPRLPRAMLAFPAGPFFPRPPIRGLRPPKLSCAGQRRPEAPCSGPQWGGPLAGPRREPTPRGRRGCSSLPLATPPAALASIPIGLRALHGHHADAAGPRTALLTGRQAGCGLASCRPRRVPGLARKRRRAGWLARVHGRPPPPRAACAPRTRRAGYLAQELLEHRLAVRPVHGAGSEPVDAGDQVAHEVCGRRDGAFQHDWAALGARSAASASLCLDVALGAGLRAPTWHWRIIIKGGKTK
jgi:hypothetical protein